MAIEKPGDERIAQAARDLNYAAIEREIFAQFAHDLAKLRARMDAAEKRGAPTVLDELNARWWGQSQTARARAAARWGKRA
jgi:hypothetical protein